jgi:hypothetical protein
LSVYAFLLTLTVRSFNIVVNYDYPGISKINSF